MQFWAAKLSAFDVLKAITCWMIFFHDFIAHTTTFTVGKSSYFLTSGITYTAKSPKITSKICTLKNFPEIKRFLNVSKTSYVAHCVSLKTLEMKYIVDMSSDQFSKW